LTSEKRWILLVFSFIAVWAWVLSTTLYTTISKTGILIDTEVDLSYITLPLLGIILLYTLVTIFIFVVYFATYNRVKGYQLRTQNLSKMDIKDEFDNNLSQTKSQIEANKICSIIIPSKNEESVIRRTIDECLRQTYDKIEVIVVCHNCTDSTYQEAKHSDSRVRAFELNTKESGKGIALNFGLEKANGNLIMILDGDGILSNDFVEKALPLFEDKYAAVQGRYIPSNRDYSLITKLLSIEGDLWSTPYMTVRSFLEKRCPLGGTGYIVRKDILIEEGLFANHLVDDYELTFRLLRKKHRIAFAPLCIDYDEKPPTMEIMLRQRARWAKGFISLLSKRIAEPTDIIGNIHWLSPIAAISGLIMLLIPAYGALHNILYGYYPYTYSYMPLNLWFILTGLIYGLQAAVLYKQYGLKGLKRALYLPVYNAFSHYWFVSFTKAFFVKSWASTKTTHGFVTGKPAIKRSIEREPTPKITRV
jgi:cellulose synthase/poly-beta-1,6-N-acetylglucosamine synthase-like glycosyltransferase